MNHERSDEPRFVNEYASGMHMNSTSFTADFTVYGGSITPSTTAIAAHASIVAAMIKSEAVLFPLFTDIKTAPPLCDKQLLQLYYNRK